MLTKGEVYSLAGELGRFALGTPFSSQTLNGLSTLVNDVQGALETQLPSPLGLSDAERAEVEPIVAAAREAMRALHAVEG
jgi:hypothetical protein